MFEGGSDVAVDVGYGSPIVRIGQYFFLVKTFHAGEIGIVIRYRIRFLVNGTFVLLSELGLTTCVSSYQGTDAKWFANGNRQYRCET